MNQFFIFSAAALSILSIESLNAQNESSLGFDNGLHSRALTSRSLTIGATSVAEQNEEPTDLFHLDMAAQQASDIAEVSSPYLYPSRTVISNFTLGVVSPQSRDLKETFNADMGFIFNAYVAVLLSRNVGISLSYFNYDMPCKYDDELWVGLSGLGIGPLITCPLMHSGRIVVDLRPSIGIGWAEYMDGEDSGSTDDPSSLALGMGASLRFNFSRVFGMSLNYDWYYGVISKVNLSSTAFTLGFHLSM